MNPRQFSAQMLQALGASIAGLFLILALYVAANLKTPARGVLLILPKEPTSSDCGDSRTEVIHWGVDGAVWLNEEEVGAERMPDRVAEIMANRAERVLFVVPGKYASVEEVVDLIARINASVDDLHVGMVTNKQITAMTRTDHGVTWIPIDCMRWPQSALTER